MACLCQSFCQHVHGLLACGSDESSWGRAIFRVPSGLRPLFSGGSMGTRVSLDTGWVSLSHDWHLLLSVCLVRATAQYLLMECRCAPNQSLVLFVVIVSCHEQHIANVRSGTIDRVQETCFRWKMLLWWTHVVVWWHCRVISLQMVSYQLSPVSCPILQSLFSWACQYLWKHLCLSAV